MKKLIVTLILTVAHMSYAGDIDWTGTFTKTVDGVDLIDNWYVAMYTGAFGTIDTGNLSSNLVANTAMNVDESAPIPALWSYGFGASVNVANNIDVFTVIYNNVDYNFASQYIVVDNAAFNAGSGGGANHPVAYGLSNVSGTWQAIPEPTTFLLFAMGGFGAWLIRRKNMR
jgi:hypothetical protein